MGAVKEQHRSGWQLFINDELVPGTRLIDWNLEDGLGEEIDQLEFNLRNPGMIYTKQRSRLKGCPVRFEAGRIGQVWDTVFKGKIGYIRRNGGPDGHKLTIKALPMDISEGWHQKRKIYYKDFTRFSDVIHEVVRLFHPEYRTDYIQDSPQVGLLVPIQTGETDVQFCQRLARESGGWEFVIKGDKVVFRPSDPTGEIVHTFRFGHNFSKYDEIESDAKSSGGSGVASNTGTNSIKTDASSAETEDTRTQDEHKADGVDRHSDSGKTPKNEQYRPGMDSSAGQAAATGNQAVPAGQESYLKITGWGSIRVRAGKCAIVEGLGDLDGKYYIKHVYFWGGKSEGMMMDVTLTNHQRGASV